MFHTEWGREKRYSLCRLVLIRLPLASLVLPNLLFERPGILPSPSRAPITISEATGLASNDGFCHCELYLQSNGSCVRQLWRGGTALFPGHLKDEWRFVKIAIGTEQCGVHKNSMV